VSSLLLPAKTTNLKITDFSVFDMQASLFKSSDFLTAITTSVELFFIGLDGLWLPLIKIHYDIFFCIHNKHPFNILPALVLRFSKDIFCALILREFCLLFLTNDRSLKLVTRMTKRGMIKTAKNMEML